MKCECIICGKGPATGTGVVRTTPHGQSAMWKCAACLNDDDRRQIAANETARKCRALKHELGP